MENDIPQESKLFDLDTPRQDIADIASDLSSNRPPVEDTPGPESLAETEATFETPDLSEPPDPLPENLPSSSLDDEPLPEFNPKHREEFDGLLYLGRLQYTFGWGGHTFKIKTLNSEDYLEVGLLMQKYVNTYGEQRAWNLAMVAASLMSVDKKSLPLPMGEDESDLEAKFAWAKKQYPWTVDKIFEEVMKLDFKVREMIESMGKVGGVPASTKS